MTVYQYEGRPYTCDATRYGETVEIPAITKAEPRGDCRIWVEYDNGEQGEVDLSDLAQRRVPFRMLNIRQYFESVCPVRSFLTWGEGELDIAPESLYMRVTGARFEDVYPIRFLDVI